VTVTLFAPSGATFAALYSTQSLIGTLARVFSIPDSHAAWSVSAATLLLGIGLLIASPLSDRWGRTTVIKGSLVATALLGGAGALAPNWPCLLVLRAAQGLALAGTPAVALTYLREEVHESVHPRATGLYIGGTAIGGMTGRLLAGAVADIAGWRYALGAVSLLGATAALIVMTTLPAARHAPSIRGHRAAHTADRWAQRPILERWSLALAPTLRALSDPRLIGLYIVAGASMGAFVTVYNVLGLRLVVAPYHLTVFAASLVFCVYPLGTVGAATAGRLAQRIGPPTVIAAGCLLVIGGLALTLASPLPLVVLGVATITIGFFAAHGVASGWAVAIGEGRHAAAQSSAFYLLAYYLGSSIFGAVGTSVWSGQGWRAVALMAAALVAVAAAIAGTEAFQSHTGSRRPRTATPQQQS
jgi:YNFM family putative membrane transporter